MRTWTLKMTIVVLSVSMVFGMSAAYGQAVLTIETDETIYSDGNKILITTVLQKHSDPPNEMTLIISNPDGGNAYLLKSIDKDIILESPKTHNHVTSCGDKVTGGPLLEVLGQLVVPLVVPLLEVLVLQWALLYQKQIQKLFQHFVHHTLLLLYTRQILTNRNLVLLRL